MNNENSIVLQYRLISLQEKCIEKQRQLESKLK